MATTSAPPTIRKVRSTIAGRIRISTADGGSKTIMGNTETQLAVADIEYHRSRCHANDDPFTNGKIIYLDGTPAHGEGASLVEPGEAGPDADGTWSQTGIEELLVQDHRKIAAAVAGINQVPLLKHMLRVADSLDVTAARRAAVSDRLSAVERQAAARKRALARAAADAGPPVPMGPRGPLTEIR